jgi:hypothetical protein
MCVTPVAEKDCLRSRERDFPGTDCSADAPLQFVFPLRLIPRFGPVVLRRPVVAAEADRHPVVILVLVSVGGRNTVFGELPSLSCQTRCERE